MNDESIKEMYYSETKESLGNLRNDADKRLTNDKLLVRSRVFPHCWRQKTKKYFTRVMDWSKLQTFHIEQVFEQIYL